jgi:hypothetical protein
MNHAYIFRWGKDTFIMKAHWGNASDKILVNGRQNYGSVGDYDHSPRKVAQYILEQAAKSDGLDVNSQEIQNKIQQVLNGLD